MPTIRAFSQPEAEFYAPNESEILISIATPVFVDTRYPPPKLDAWANNAVLRLNFHDSDPQVWNSSQHQHMTIHEAYQILDFIEANPNKDVVIHCWKGVSRSATIAMSLSNLYAKEGYVYVNLKPTKTNEHVRDLLYKAAKERHMERAILAAFLAYQQRSDIHPEEAGMSSHMFEAGWNACLKYLNT